jgi:hypothetical protein
MNKGGLTIGDHAHLSGSFGSRVDVGKATGGSGTVSLRRVEAGKPLRLKAGLEVGLTGKQLGDVEWRELMQRSLACHCKKRGSNSDRRILRSRVLCLGLLRLPPEFLEKLVHGFLVGLSVAAEMSAEAAGVTSKSSARLLP